MGALAASARLAVAGHRVAVYERTDGCGGAVRSFEREGFRFDTGPGLLHLPAVYRDLFLKTGREPLEDRVELVRVEPAVRHVFPDGRAVSLPGSSRSGVVSALDAALGAGSGARWADLLTRARTAWDATRRPLLEEPLVAGDEAAPGRERDPYPALRRRGLLRRRAPRLAEVAADELRDPRLAAMLDSSVQAYGLDPRTAPAGAAVLPYLEHTFGTWHVRGGIGELARALYERCTARGVTFHFGTGVRRVREREGRAAGLELADGREVDADLVVAGAPLWDGGEGADGAPDTAGAGARGAGAASGWARLTVLLALRGARPADTVHRTLVHRADAPGQPLTVLRPDDPALRPDGAHESAVLSVPVPADPDGAGGTGSTGGTDGGRGGQAKAHRELAERLVAAADAAGLGLGPRVLWSEVRTPREYAAETGAPGGALAPPVVAGPGAPSAAANRAPLPGLYRVGGWAHPGGGLAHAGMSGALAAGLIVEGDDWRGSY